jgi:amino acid transporter
MAKSSASAPKATLSAFDGVMLLVGIVIGIGIFKTPSLVAANVQSETAFITLWLLGGFVAMMGAFCYAELGASHPSTGGEYHFLSRAYGKPVGLLFAWARGTVIQTGAIAAVAFVYGDYASQILPLGTHSVAIHAAIAVIVLTAVNVVGTPEGKRLQWILAILTVVAIVAVVVGGLSAPAAAPRAPSASATTLGAAGFAMVFVLLTYGGWNEAAYLSGELKDVKRNMARTLLIAVGIVTACYLLVNLAYLNVFGLEGLRKSNAIGADLMKAVTGGAGATLFSLIVCVCALSTLNATIFTGARVYFALGQDLKAARMLGTWDARGHNPSNSFLLQGLISLVLIGFGATTREGFEAMVAYTSPVFWFFLLLVAISVFVFRSRDHKALPYRMPLYPLPPILLGIASAWMVYSSLLYAGLGSIIGVAVLLAGTPLLLLSREQISGRKTPKRKR